MNTNKEYSIFDILNMALQRWWIVACCMIIGGSAMYIFSYYVSKPVYQSVGTLYISNVNKTNQQRPTDEISLNEIVTSQELLKSSVEVLNTSKFYSHVKEVSKLPYSPARLKGMVTMAARNETEILEITVKSDSPKTSYILLETVISLAKEEIEWVVEGGSIKALDHASYSSDYLPRNIGRNSLLGALVGALAGIGLIFVLELIDTRIKSSNDLSENYNYYILGEIPSIID